MDPISQEVEKQWERFWRNFVIPGFRLSWKHGMHTLFFMWKLLTRELTLTPTQLPTDYNYSMLLKYVDLAVRGKIHDKILTTDNSMQRYVFSLAKKHNIKLTMVPGKDGVHASFVIQPLKTIGKVPVHSDIEGFIQAVQNDSRINTYSMMSVQEFIQMQKETEEDVKKIMDFSQNSKSLELFNEYVLSIFNKMSSPQHFVSFSEFESVSKDLNDVYKVLDKVSKGQADKVTKEELIKMHNALTDVVTMRHIIEHDKISSVEHIKQLDPLEKFHKLQDSVSIQMEYPKVEDLIKKVRTEEDIGEMTIEQSHKSVPILKKHIQSLVNTINNSQDEDKSAKEMAERNLVLLLMDEKVHSLITKTKKQDRQEIENMLRSVKINGYKLKPDLTSTEPHFVFEKNGISMDVKSNLKDETKMIVFEKIFGSGKVKGHKVLDEHIDRMAVVTKPVTVMFTKFAEAIKQMAEQESIKVNRNVSVKDSGISISQ